MTKNELCMATDRVFKAYSRRTISFFEAISAVVNADIEYCVTLQDQGYSVNRFAEEDVARYLLRRDYRSGLRLLLYRIKEREKNMDKQEGGIYDA